MRVIFTRIARQELEDAISVFMNSNILDLESDSRRK